jgi:hypothetical protein
MHASSATFGWVGAQPWFRNDGGDGSFGDGGEGSFGDGGDESFGDGGEGSFGDGGHGGEGSFGDGSDGSIGDGGEGSFGDGGGMGTVLQRTAGGGEGESKQSLDLSGGEWRIAATIHVSITIRADITVSPRRRVADWQHGYLRGATWQAHTPATS